MCGTAPSNDPVMTVIDVERALRTALSRGGDWAELFWERNETPQLVLDDQRIEDAITGVGLVQSLTYVEGRVLADVCVYRIADDGGECLALARSF
jgi:hypothetical protein